MMSRTDLISVIIPCYNGERFIGRAVESVLAQTFSPLELIVIDDGSTDASRSMIDGFAKDGRVRAIYHGSNRGIPAARNAGISAAAGRYIAFLDQDDYWLRNKLERQAAVFAGDGGGEIGLVFSDMRIVDARGNTIRMKRGRIPRGFNELSRADMLRALFGDNFIPIVSSLVRRECFDSVGLLDERIIGGGDDYEFCLRLLTSYRAFAIDEPLAVRTRHGANYTDAARMIPDVLRVIDEFAERVPEVKELHGSRKSSLLCDMGGYYQRIGDSRQARRYFREAMDYAPGGAKASLGYLSSSSGIVGRGAARLWYCMRDILDRFRR